MIVIKMGLLMRKGEAFVMYKSMIINGIKKSLSILLIHLFNLLPLKNNKLFLFSYYGSQYGCNPKYITEYILNTYPKDRFDIVWAFNDSKSKEDIIGVRKVKTMSLKYFYELCTSKVLITNFRTTDLFIKRRGQYYIQTWHSSLRLKQIEKDAEESLPDDYIKMAKRDSLKCDLLVSGCEFSTQIFKRAFWYNGEIFEHGTPRNDVLFQTNDDIRKKILNKLNISLNFKIILYAPTFRKSNDMNVYNLNFDKIVEKLTERFGGRWIFLIKLHPHLISQSSQLSKCEYMRDVTSYDDIQELLCISDVLITDYSSLMFDFSITKRPCFLFVPDILEYTSHDRHLYFDLHELPFVHAANNQDLLEKIIGFDYEEYANASREFLNQIGSFENGKACENLLQKVCKVCFKKEENDTCETVQGRLYNGSI